MIEDTGGTGSWGQSSPIAPNRRILCVDDEPNVLGALARILSESFVVDTAASGEEALAAITKVDYAAIVSDMRMPGMTGAALLAKVRVTRPDSVRILLTGDADVESAILAVNDGKIFRFLTKPCPSATLRKTLELAVEQHALVRAERDLLDGTLRGIVKLLTDVLALVSPGVFARSTRLKALVTHAVKQLKLKDEWMYEVAALLSPLGCIALPDDIVARSFAGQEVTDVERASFVAHPETAFRLLADIPRLDKVAAIVRAQHAMNDEGAPHEDETVALGIVILRAAIEIEARVANGATHKAATLDLRLGVTNLPTRVLAAFESFRAGGGSSSVMGLPIAQLTVGMIADEDVLAVSGSVIVPKGTELGVVTLERLRKFALGIGVREPVRVRMEG